MAESILTLESLLCNYTLPNVEELQLVYLGLISCEQKGMVSNVSQQLILSCQKSFNLIYIYLCCYVQQLC